MRSQFAAVILFTSFAWIPSANAQVQEIWTRMHDGSALLSDQGTAIAVDAAGNAFVTGLSQGLPAGNANMATVAYDAAGNLLWNQEYPVPLHSDARATAIALSPQGDVYVAGGWERLTGTGQESWQQLIKYSASGALMWTHRYGTPTSIAGNNAYAMILDAQGNVILGGSAGVTNTDFSVRKIDPAGNVLWTIQLDGSTQGADYVNALALAPNGDVLAVGRAHAQNTPDSKIAVLRVDANGVLLWEREIDPGSSGEDFAFDVAVDAVGNAYVAGSFSVSFTGDFANQALVALDPAGTTLWIKNIDGGANRPDAFEKVRIDPSGRIVAAGYLTRVDSIHANVTVFDASGNVVWATLFEEPGHVNDSWSALEVDRIGNIHVAGSTLNLTPPGQHQAAIASEYDPSGALRYQHIHAPPITLPATTGYQDIALGPNGSVYLVGTSSAGFQTGDIMVVRLDRTAIPFCFGDGSGTACPCGNVSGSIQQSGCVSSLGLAARLIDTGTSSLSADTFTLNGSDMPNSSCLYFQGTLATAGGAGAVFGDGLRCATGTTIRLGSKTNVNNASQYPSIGDPSVSVRGGLTAIGERTYQIWYRNAAPFCTPSTFNLSNGLRVTWTP